MYGRIWKIWSATQAHWDGRKKLAPGHNNKLALDREEDKFVCCQGTKQRIQLAVNWFKNNKENQENYVCGFGPFFSHSSLRWYLDPGISSITSELSVAS